MSDRIASKLLAEFIGDGAAAVVGDGVGLFL
jgi:hypothetical protein